jgi:hypothetical protein
LSTPTPPWCSVWIVKLTTSKGDDIEDVHVIPLGDMHEHALTVDCWCCPTRDDENDAIIIHYAADEREKFESGERLPS